MEGQGASGSCVFKEGPGQGLRWREEGRARGEMTEPGLKLCSEGNGAMAGFSARSDMI